METSGYKYYEKHFLGIFLVSIHQKELESPHKKYGPGTEGEVAKCGEKCDLCVIPETGSQLYHRRISNIVQGPFAIRKEAFHRIGGLLEGFRKVTLLEFFLRSKGELKIAKLANCSWTPKITRTDRGTLEESNNFWSIPCWEINTRFSVLSQEVASSGQLALQTGNCVLRNHI